MALLVIACSAFGDIPSGEYFRDRFLRGESDDFSPRVPAGRLTLSVKVSDSEENTLVMYAAVYGKGSWSYRITSTASGEEIASGSSVSFRRDRKTAIWHYEIPEPGKSVRYAVKATFQPKNGRTITERKHVTIRNVKGVIQIVIE